MNNPKRSEAEPRDGRDLESLTEQYKDNQYFVNQRSEILNFFKGRPKTVSEVAHVSGGDRNVISRHATLFCKYGFLHHVKTGKCPVTGFKAFFYSRHLSENWREI